MKRLAIIGSGDLGQQIAYYAKEDNQFRVVGFFDDYKGKGELVNEIPVLGGSDDVLTIFNQGFFDELLIGIGYKHIIARGAMFNRYKNNVPFARLVHSSCIVDASCVINEGVVVYPGCILAHHVEIRQNVLLNVGCCIAHDTLIGANSFLSPRVAIAGFVTVEDSCILGINCTVIDNVVIKKQTQIGGGAVVIKSIERSGLYVGNPVRFIR
jgi:sugar O-acyltransferase (sialic acid O-acetyltransferase NeuD family)